MHTFQWHSQAFQPREQATSVSSTPKQSRLSMPGPHDRLRNRRCEGFCKLQTVSTCYATQVDASVCYLSAPSASEDAAKKKGSQSLVLSKSRGHWKAQVPCQWCNHVHGSPRGRASSTGDQDIWAIKPTFCGFLVPVPAVKNPLNEEQSSSRDFLMSISTYRCRRTDLAAVRLFPFQHRSDMESADRRLRFFPHAL